MMDMGLTALLLFAVATAFATFRAWRGGDDRRDVAILGMTTGCVGAGALAVAAL